MTAPLLAFYYGSAPDHRGRYLAEILRQDDVWLEVTHDYIQWLFPLREGSGVNPQAPRLTPQIEAAFHSDDQMREDLRAACRRMLSFYGLTERAEGIVPGENWLARKTNWAVHDTHNNLRITRILKSLTLLGLRDAALRLLACLEDLRENDPDWGVSDSSFRYWREAVAG